MSKIFLTLTLGLLVSSSPATSQDWKEWTQNNPTYNPGHTQNRFPSSKNSTSPHSGGQKKQCSGEVVLKQPTFSQKQIWKTNYGDWVIGNSLTATHKGYVTSFVVKNETNCFVNEIKAFYEIIQNDKIADVNSLSAKVYLKPGESLKLSEDELEVFPAVSSYRPKLKTIKVLWD